MNVLVVAAHPDDEVLGCGGTMAHHAEKGNKVHVIFLADGLTSRGETSITATDLERRKEAAHRACETLGAHPPRFLGLPDNRLDSLSLLDVVQQIEPVIAEVKPISIYTHHGGDLNVDHRVAHQAVMTACRPQPGFYVRAIYSFEVPSSTEWSSSAIGTPFCPTLFVDVTKYLERKIQALRFYTEEIHDFPHARSLKAVQAQALLRGVSVGVEAAEAFMVERQLIS